LNGGWGALLVVATVGAGAVTASTAPVAPPNVSLPALPAPPPVSLPQVPVPAAPPAPVPIPAVPAVPSPPAVQAPAAPSPAPVGTTGARALGVAVGSATSEVASAPAQLASGAARPSRARTGNHGGWNRGERKRVRRLRHEVRRYRGCFSILSRRSQRVLELHLGLRPARRPHSRRAVAQRYDTSSRRIARRERRSIGRLRRAARSGGCTGDFASSASAQAGGGSAFNVALVGSDVGSGASEGQGDRIGVAGVEESGGSNGDEGGARKRPPGIPGTGFVNNVGDDLQDLAGIVGGLLALALALALFALYRKGALERPAWLRRSGDSS
jgi:hypothetical protein